MTWASDYAEYPCTVTLDRYNGLYAEAPWLAWPLEAAEVPMGHAGGCPEKFWKEYTGCVGRGDSPDEAIVNLALRLENEDITA